MSLLKTVISGAGTQNSHAQVVNELGKEIVGGQFPEGANLPKDKELTSRFQVSRTVLREAMKTLSAKGLVVARARVGTRVTPRSDWHLFDKDILTWHFQNGVDQKFLNHLCDMRLSFEPNAAMLAAQNANDDQIKKLYGAISEMRLASSHEEFALADLKIHMTVLEASGNPFMISVGNIVEAAFVSLFRMSSPTGDSPRRNRAVADHALIADAIRDHDVDAARAAMHSVIETGRSNMLGTK